MGEGEGKKVLVVGELRGRAHEEGCFKQPSHSVHMLTSFVALGHYVMLVLHKIMVKVNIMRPDPSLVREVDLFSVGDMVGDGAVVDVKVLRGCYVSLWVEHLVGQDSTGF